MFLYVDLSSLALHSLGRLPSFDFNLPTSWLVPPNLTDTPMGLSLSEEIKKPLNTSSESKQETRSLVMLATMTKAVFAPTMTTKVCFVGRGKHDPY